MIQFDGCIFIQVESTNLDGPGWKLGSNIKVRIRGLQPPIYPMYNWVVVRDNFYFHPYLGKIPFLTDIFQMGWNHQLDK